MGAAVLLPMAGDLEVMVPLVSFWLSGNLKFILNKKIAPQCDFWFLCGGICYNVRNMNPVRDNSVMLLGLIGYTYVIIINSLI